MQREISSSENKKFAAMRLIQAAICEFPGNYFAFGLVVTLSSLITLLPVQLLRYFTLGISQSFVNAPDFALRLILFGVAVAIALSLSTFLNVWGQEWLRISVESKFRKAIIRRLHEMNLSEIDGAQRGDWLTRMTADLSRVENFVTESLPNQLRHLVIVAASGGLFIYYTGFYGLIPMASVLLILVLNMYAQKKISPALSQLRGLHANVFQMMIESLEGIRTVRSHGAQDYIEKRFDRSLSTIKKEGLRAAKILGAIIGGTHFANQAMITTILVAFTFLISKGSFSLQGLLFYPFFLGLFYASAQSLGSAFYDWNRFLIEGSRLSEILAHPPKSAVVKIDGGESIVARGIAFGHKNCSLTEPIDFEFHRGEILIVSGPSGSGKTALIETLAGLRDLVGGTVEIRGKSRLSIAGGQSLPTELCSYVEQSSYIFEGTIRDNLLLGNPKNLGDKDLLSALERTGLEKLARLGLDHFLCDRGRNLSEGERYRISFCRALLLERPFLLLDEPFAALDEANIEFLVALLLKETARAAILIVTHHIPETLPHNKKMVFVPNSDRVSRVEIEIEEGFAMAPGGSLAINNNVN